MNKEEEQKVEQQTEEVNKDPNALFLTFNPKDYAQVGTF